MVSSLRTHLKDSTSLAQIAADPLKTALWICDEQSRRPLKKPTLSLSGAEPAEQIRRVALAALLEQDSLDDAIDQLIANKNTAPVALEALLRAGEEWDHPSLLTYAQEQILASLVAPHLAIADPDAFASLLDEIDDEELLFALLRQAALSGEAIYFELVQEWIDALGDDLTRSQSDALNAHLATLDPIRYARLLIAQEASADWLRDDRLLADFLTVHGPSDWIETLAIFRTFRDVEAFELAAAFATSAALTFIFDDIDDERLDPADALRWLKTDPSRVAFQLALGTEEDFAELLIAATLHQTLLERGIIAPAIAGLPFSGPAQDLNPAALLTPLWEDQSPLGRVALFRSLTDLRRLAKEGLISAEQLQEALTTTPAPLQAEVQQYIDAFDDESAFSSHTDWGCRGVYHAHRQLRRAPQDAVPALTQGLFEAPIERAPLYRLAIEALFSAHESSEI